MARTPQKTLIRRREVLARTGHSDTGLDRAMQDHGFPEPIKIGARAVAWVEDEVDAWIEARIAASRSGGRVA